MLEFVSFCDLQRACATGFERTLSIQTVIQSAARSLVSACAPLRLNCASRTLHTCVLLLLAIILALGWQAERLDVAARHADSNYWLIWVDGLGEELGGERELAHDFVLVLLGRGWIVRHCNCCSNVMLQ